MFEFLEKCWFLYGKHIGKHYVGFKRYHTKGSFASVTFNWKKAFNSNLLGWSHTHPDGIDIYPSDRDDNTMKAWVIAMGRSLLCDIANDRGKHNCWIYERVTSLKKDYIINKRPIKLIYFGPFFIII